MDKRITKVVHYTSTIRYTIENDVILKARNWMIQPELSQDKKTLSFFLPKDCIHSRMYFHEYMEYDLNEDKEEKLNFPNVVVKNRRVGNSR